jgi:transposase-like protein
LDSGPQTFLTESDPPAKTRRQAALSDAKHRTSKYLNRIIEANHGGIKRMIAFSASPPVAGEFRFVNKLFNIAA